MFETEAKEYRNHNTNYYEWDDFCADDGEAIETAYQKGAIDAYNKANEWHYPSKGEYPTEYKDILICFLTEDDMKDCVRGWYEYDLDEDEHYFKTVNTFGTAIIKNVIAWKEIVLPKESE